MEWFKKHVDTVIILGAILSSVLWMNSKFNAVDSRFAKVDLQFKDVDLKFKDVEREISIMKTVLIMKNIIPDQLAISDKDE